MLFFWGLYWSTEHVPLTLLQILHFFNPDTILLYVMAQDCSIPLFISSSRLTWLTHTLHLVSQHSPGPRMLLWVPPLLPPRLLFPLGIPPAPPPQHSQADKECLQGSRPLESLQSGPLRGTRHPSSAGVDGEGDEQTKKKEQSPSCG